MTVNDNPADLKTVACDICLKEVPLSEAIVPEATDYVVHFCGVDCYHKWMALGASPTQLPGGNDD